MLDATMTNMMNTSKRGNVTMVWIPTRNEFSLKKRCNGQFELVAIYRIMFCLADDNERMIMMSMIYI